MRWLKRILKIDIMNKLQKEWLALRKSAGIYLRYRKNPVDFSNEWMLERKGKKYIEWFFNYRNQLKKFYNLYKGKDCFILGNGPSLNKMDLEKLNNYYTFGLNKIYLIFHRVNLNIDFLVSVNPFVIEQSIQEFNSMNIPKFLSYIATKDHKSLDEQTYFLFTNSKLDFTDNILQPVNEGYTVTYVALQLAYYMGFKNVFLIGVDHNYKQKGNPNEKQIFTGEDINHFDPNYFKGKEWQLADLEASEIAYAIARFYYERSNRKIYDATVDGKLNVFPKIDFPQAMKMAQKK